MTTNAADDFEAIRRRLEELKADKQEALTGSSAPIEDHLHSIAHPEWPYAGTAHEWRGFVNQK